MTPLILLLWACRADLGEPSYPDPEPWVDDTGSSALLGPDPYVEGERRLSLAIFYEGGASEVDPTDHFYIFENTFSVSPSDERVEGLSSDLWVHTGGPWWGGGIFWDEARDLSGWTTLNVDLRAPAEGGLSGVDLGLVGGVEGRVNAAAAGFSADGEWHHLVIPLADFAAAGADLALVTSPLVVAGEGGAEGDVLYIDNLYLE
ncbi:MAG: hypothetical protein IPN01_10660 [Deltaproteobacteria bacterium]|nr:hypothetical protein [Deltaproteobacteria bacterium]